MILIVDSGSTKCDWIAVDENGEQLFDKIRTQGMNPAIISSEQLLARIKESDQLIKIKAEVTNVFFYGAGCGTVKPSAALKAVLQGFFTNAEASVAEDTLAAVYAAVNHKEEAAVVCILGTGSNCSYYDGKIVHQKVVSLGYTLMDDAAGNYYGKQLIRDYYYHHMPENLRQSFANQYDLGDDAIKEKLYKQPNPNVYLASFAEFMFSNKEHSYITELIKEGIRVFSKNMILQYKEEIKTVPVHFAGSIAYFSRDEILDVAEEFGYTAGNFIRRPIEGLVKYHVKNLKEAKKA